MLRAEIFHHCRILSCETHDIVPYVLAGLGFIGANLGYFAEADYVSQCHEIIHFSLTTVRSLA